MDQVKQLPTAAILYRSDSSQTWRKEKIIEDSTQARARGDAYPQGCHDQANPRRDAPATQEPRGARDASANQA